MLKNLIVEMIKKTKEGKLGWDKTPVKGHYLLFLVHGHARLDYDESDVNRPIQLSIFDNNDRKVEFSGASSTSELFCIEQKTLEELYEIVRANATYSSKTAERMLKEIQQL